MILLLLVDNWLRQSIPSIPYLEKEFSCHALHLPLGQSTVRAAQCLNLQYLTFSSNRRIKPTYLMNGYLCPTYGEESVSSNASCPTLQDFRDRFRSENTSSRSDKRVHERKDYRSGHIKRIVH